MTIKKTLFFLMLLFMASMAYGQERKVTWNTKPQNSSTNRTPNRSVQTRPAVQAAPRVNLAAEYAEGMSQYEKKNYEKALEYFGKIADRDKYANAEEKEAIAMACFRLGEMYEDGKGVILSRDIAKKWYDKAALWWYDVIKE